MLSVIELAQLLTGALDEKFNIINKAGVVQVVSCLEAFNITHESYREVQNTRIIKDLQALRQNKANDQILAKRIKNLLRKWKERLASTVTPPVTSHPNSPQNISQGSSDTQFMTQQSQSPPISQPINHIRAVNGPTSFSNLLPKPPQHPQNHHHLIQMPLTSPVPVPYQNGSQDSTPLLGKRKFDPTGPGDMDENSNHSRRKLMKRSNDIIGAISSPLNNSSINHNHLPTPPVPVTVMQPIVAQAEAPKKRGRKKGSKGIDSMLNGTIPDFQAEIKQKIALSTGKRNKTTMELQQMLESHQNTASSLSWTNGDGVDSSSLDRGFHSNSSFHAPETSHDGFIPKIKQEIRVKEEPSLLEPVPSTSQPQPSASRSLNIEEKIAQLRAQLPPIDYEAAALDVFEEFSTLDEYGETVECSCTLKEVITYQGVEEAIPESGKPPPVVPRQDSDDDDDETDDFCAVEDDEDVDIPPPRSRGAVQSIFDPEYDANENVIEEMVRRKPLRDHASKVIEVKVDKQAIKASRIEPILEPPPPESLERIPITNYVCEEDPMCPARAHFQRDPVTCNDVKSLHKDFVAGVNGFWNGISVEKPDQDYAKDMENIDYSKHQLWKRVVPRYDFLTLDKIPKTFDDDSPFSVPPPPLESESDGKPSNGNAKKSDIEFREWHELMNVRSYNDEVLTIMPYVIID